MTVAVWGRWLAAAAQHHETALNCIFGLGKTKFKYQRTVSTEYHLL